MRTFFLSHPRILRLCVWGAFTAVMLAIAAVGSATIEHLGIWPVVAFTGCLIGAAFVYDRRGQH
jgi:hypothetical protein